jgi:alkanesulfonate monooxygenase SsuD/methylene tetrahydromethanopterin reductase-like flavin-dependent oxidoreductase (luciferase family)
MQPGLLFKLMEVDQLDDQTISCTLCRPDRTGQHRPARHAGKRPPVSERAAQRGILDGPRCGQGNDELGYYAFWTAEHHFQREGYECLPSLIQLGLWLATQTRHLKFGCAFNILPMWHPIRLAEDYAMADIVTDGRVIMGVGRGYHTREVETFGAPLLDAEGNRELFEEQLQLLIKCFNEETFHHKGKYYECPPSVPYRGYQLEEITVVPRPKHLPVEVWMPIASGRTIDMMAKYGLKAMVTLNGEKILDDVVRAFHAACVRHGRPSQLGQDMIWGAGVYLADSREEAIRRVEPSHDERYKWFAPFGFVRYADEQGRTWGTPGAPARVPSLRDGVEQKAWFCGPPSQVIEGIKSIEAKYSGLEDFMIHWAEGLPPEEFKEQLRWFAKDVIPAFNRG